MKTVDRLRQYRQQCEREAGTSVDQIEVPVLHVLADLCRTLKLSRQQRKKVLGRQGTLQLSDMQTWQVDVVRPKPSRRAKHAPNSK